MKKVSGSSSYSKILIDSALAETDCRVHDPAWQWAMAEQLYVLAVKFGYWKAPGSAFTQAERQAVHFKGEDMSRDV